MLEYNVRSASTSGMWVQGIGLHLKLYAESADSWNKFSLVLLCILIIVTLLDFTGEKIRKLLRINSKDEALVCQTELAIGLTDLFDFS